MAEQNESFEQILEKLHALVRELEQGGLPLEQSLKRFEEGIRLSREGAKRLEEAERRVEEILADGTTSPLDLGDDGDAKAE